MTFREKMKNNAFIYSSFTSFRNVCGTVRNFFFPPYQVDWSNIPLYEKNIEEAYRKRFNRKLNLENPKTFSEKMQWLRVYDNTDLKTELCDKFLVKPWVANRIGEEYVIPTLGVWNNPDEIDFTELPEQFVLKCNHGCGYNIIVKDKSTLDIEAARKKLGEWLKEDFALLFGEMQYRNVKRKIIAEKYIENIQGDIFDYKYFCFNGEPAYILFCCDRSSGVLKDAFFDLNWNKQKFIYAGELYTGPDVPKPVNMELMTELVRTLAKDFKHVRVDFYNINGVIYFGEMTFTSYGGYFGFQPPEWDLRIGKLLKL